MAQEIGDNNLIDTWASGGTIIEPDSTKKDQGWTLGEKPPHEFMNYLQNEFGKQLNYLMRSGVAAHNVSTEYLVNDIVTSGGSVWIALANNTNSVPSSVNTNWRRIITVDDIPDASETTKGLIEHATQAEVDAGTAGNFAVTPGKIRFGFAASLGSNGYIKFPSWLGGVIFQWGSIAATVRPGEFNFGPINFPLAFPNQVFNVQATTQPGPGVSAGDHDSFAGTRLINNSSFDLFAGSNIAVSYNYGIAWFAIGR